MPAFAGIRYRDWTVVAETGEQFQGFAPYVPSIDDAGTVAFQAATAAGGTGVFTGRDGSIATIAERAADSTDAFISHPDLNVRGEICVYAGTPEAGRALWSFRDGRSAPLATSGSQLAAIGPLGPTMNDAGAVAFRADLVGSGSAVLIAHGGKVDLLTDTNRRFASFHGLPVINRHGAVVFRADLPDGTKGIFLQGGPTLVTVADTRGEFADIVAFPSVNDDGAVAFGAMVRRGGVGVFTAREGRISRVIEPSDRFESIRNALVDGTGRVRFAATPRGRSLGVYAGPDPDKDRIIGLGDTHFGAAVEEFALNPVSVNSAGSWRSV